jgi:hypothetical protein
VLDQGPLGWTRRLQAGLCKYPPNATGLREAKPGQILISPRVLTKVENAMRVEPFGEFELKGIRRPMAAYNVVGAVR